MKTLCTASDPATPPLRGNRGFTLVELVIVLTVMSVFLSMAMPHLQQRPSLQVHGVARMLGAHLELARANALGQRFETRIVFDESDDSYTAYVDHDRDGNFTLSQTERAAFPAFGVRELEGLVLFGRGDASKIPGDAAEGAVTLTGGVLDMNTQGIPEPRGTMGTVYLVHRDDPTAVSAVSISSSGSFQSWRWSEGEGVWK